MWFISRHFTQHPDCRTDNKRVKLGAGILLEFFRDLLWLESFAIWAIRCHGFDCIRDSNDPCLDRDLTAGDPIRISPAVIVLVMLTNNRDKQAKRWTVFDEITTQSRMRFNDLIFLTRLSSGFRQDFHGNTKFSNIVQQSGLAHQIHLFFLQP